MFTKIILSAALIAASNGVIHAAAARAVLTSQQRSVIRGWGNKPYIALDAIKNSSDVVAFTTAPLDDSAFSIFHKMLYIYANECWLNPRDEYDVVLQQYNALIGPANVHRRLLLLRDKEYAYRNGEMFAGVAIATPTPYQTGKRHLIASMHLDNDTFHEQMMAVYADQHLRFGGAQLISALEQKKVKQGTPEQDFNVTVSKLLAHNNTALADALKALAAEVQKTAPNAHSFQNHNPALSGAGMDHLTNLTTTLIRMEQHLAFLGAQKPGAAALQRQVNQQGKTTLFHRLAKGNEKEKSIISMAYALQDPTFARMIRRPAVIHQNLRPANAAAISTPVRALVTDLHATVYQPILAFVHGLDGQLVPLNARGAALAPAVQVVPAGSTVEVEKALTILLERVETLRAFKHVLLLLKYNTDDRPGGTLKTKEIDAIAAKVAELEKNVLEEIDNAVAAIPDNLPCLRLLRMALVGIANFVSLRNLPFSTLTTLYRPELRAFLALNPQTDQHALSTYTAAAPRALTDPEIRDWANTFIAALQTNFPTAIDRPEFVQDLQAIVAYAGVAGQTLRRAVVTAPQFAKNHLEKAMLAAPRIVEALANPLRAHLFGYLVPRVLPINFSADWGKVIQSELFTIQHLFVLIPQRMWTTINEIADPAERDKFIQVNAQNINDARQMLVNHINVLIECIEAGYMDLDVTYDDPAAGNAETYLDLANMPQAAVAVNRLGRTGAPLQPAAAVGAAWDNALIRAGIPVAARALFTVPNLVALRQAVEKTKKLEPFQAIYDNGKPHGMNINADLLEQRALVDAAHALTAAQKLVADDIHRIAYIASTIDILCREIAAAAEQLK